MSKMKLCPYCGQKHRLLSAFKRCGKRNTKKPSCRFCSRIHRTLGSESRCAKNNAPIAKWLKNESGLVVRPVTKPKRKKKSTKKTKKKL